MILTLVIAVFVGIVVIFYVALSNKTDVVTDEDPYRAVMNKPLVTVRPTMIIDNVTVVSQKPEYARQLVEETMNIDTTQIEHQLIPVGAAIKFAKAVHFTSAVSGSQYAILIGTVTPKGGNAALPVMYHWGTFKSICIDEPCNYWEYETAPWEVAKP